MFATLARRASATDLPPQAAAAARELLPPLILYRRVLRAHRHLPREMRILGDDYVKAEFRRCRKIENPLHLIGFLSQWKEYTESLATESDPSAPRGHALRPEMLEKLSAEQLGQLYELMSASREVWKPAEAAVLPDDASEDTDRGPRT